MMMKNLFRLGLVAVPFAVCAATSTPKGFTDDLDAALASAKTSGKYVYACFSGSDWCGWCIKLEKEVFSSEAFATALKDDYELVFIDSPRDKSRLSESAKVKNPEFTKKYGIRGFPSMIIFDGKDGSEVKRASAYRPGGVDAYVAFLKDIRAKGPDLKRLEALEAEWTKPMKDKIDALMRELNDACGKYVEDRLAKPDNTKTKDELRRESIVVVKDFLPRFRAVVTEFEEKAGMAPDEVKENVLKQARSMAQWLGNVEASVK